MADELVNVTIDGMQIAVPMTFASASDQTIV